MVAGASTELGIHRVPRSVFDEFCFGPVSEESMGAIKDSQYSSRRLRLIAVFEVAPPSEALENAWATLAEVEDRRPEIVAAVLMSPPVGVWLVAALQEKQTAWSQFGYLYSLVAAVAIRAGYSCDIDIPIDGGIVSFPTVGDVRLPWQSARSVKVRNSSTGLISITSSEGTVTFSVGGQGSGFTPTTKHEVSSGGVRLVVEINDTDPYREFNDPLPPRRLDPAELAAWRHLLDDAWSLLASRHKSYARELATGLSTLIPIGPERHVAGASCSAAFGGVALSAKNSATALAEVLVHELQHSKLNALLDLVQLQQGGSECLWYAPWRSDARPLVGLLHGIYAFVSVVEFWRIERDLLTDPGESRAAQFAFAHRRHQVREAVESIRSVPELTEQGQRLVDVVSGRLAECEAEHVPEEMLQIVRQMADDSRATWRLRHMRHDTAVIQELAEAWLDGEPQAPCSSLPGHVTPGVRYTTVAARTSLLTAKAVDPDQFAEFVRSVDHLDGTTTHADVAFAVDDHGLAATGYSTRIRQASGDVHAWAGLSLTSSSLSRSPDAVFAVHNQIVAVSGKVPDPLELADWMA